MATNVGFRVRVRVRIGKALTSELVELTTQIDGRDVTIKSQLPEQPLKEAKWIIFSARGFETEADAKAFGDHIKQVLTLACLSVRLGVDVGSDKPTSWIDEDFARASGLIQSHERIAPNVHGTLVTPDDDLTRIAVIEANASVSADPGALLTALEQSDRGGLDFSAAERGIRVMNQALMHPEPLGQLLLAFSTVEALGQTEEWSSAQAQLISEASAAVASGLGDAAVPEAERAEVASAISKGLFRLSLRQGVLRVLRDNDLLEYKSKWDDLYGERSGLVHGTKSFTDAEINELAQKALDLCGIVIMRVLANAGVSVPAVTSDHWGQWLNRDTEPA